MRPPHGVFNAIVIFGRGLCLMAVGWLMAVGAKNPKLLALRVSTWSHLTQVML